MKWPLTSVILPVYNGEKYLAQAIESVMDQRYEPIELIVVDDGSEDGAADIARSSPGVRYLRQENQGPSLARNAGIAVARGEVLAFIDHDDTWPADKLDIQVGYLLNNPGVECTLGQMELVFDAEVDVPPWLEPYLAPGHGRPLIYGMSIVASKAAFGRVGGFSPEYRFNEDIDWVVRAMDAGVGVAMLPDIVVSRRVHESNLSHQNQMPSDWMLRALRDQVHRARTRRRPHGSEVVGQ